MPNTKHRITPRSLLELKIPHSPCFSPDGKRVVFAVSEADFEESRWISRLWMADIPDGNARRITHSYEGERAPRWSPDGRFIAFLSTRPDMTTPPPSMDEEEEQAHKEQLWAIPADGGEAFRLTNHREGVRSFHWAPGGQTLIYLAPESRPQPLQHARDDARKRRIDPVVERDDKLRMEFWEIDLEEKKPELLYAGDFGIAEFDVAPDGNRLVFNSNRTGEPNDYPFFDLHILDLESGETTKIVERAGGKFQPRWSPDGKEIVFAANLNPALSYSQECVWRVSSSGGEPQNLFADCNCDAIHIEWPRADGRLYITAADRTMTPLFRLDPEGLGSALTGDLEVEEFAIGPKGEIAAIFEKAAEPPELYYSAEDVELTPLTELNKEFSERYEVPRQEVIRWTSSDGLEIEGVLTYPLSLEGERGRGGEGETTTRRPNDPTTEDEHELGTRNSELGTAPPLPLSPSPPLLVQVHGGPKGRATNSLRSYHMHMVWASEGYLVFRPNFRGSEGYGNDFAVANRRDLGGGDFRDIMSGVDHLIERGLADPNRLGIMGGSYGGYMANWAISQTDRFKAAVSAFGIFNLVTDFSNSDLSRWDPDYMGATYWEDPEIYQRCSPATYLKNISTPVLILHGQSDTNTFIANSKEMYQALRERGVTVQFVHYPREAHGLREPNHRLDEARRCLAWMDRYLKNGGEAQPHYRIGDRITHEGYEFQVIRAEDAEYAGWHDEWGRLLEVALSLGSADAVEDAWRFDLIEAKLTPVDGSEPCPIRGVPVDIGGGRTLVSGEGLYVDVHPDKDTGRLSASIAIAYEVPAEGGEFTLKIVDFPPVHFAIGPKPEKEPEHAPSPGEEPESTPPPDADTPIQTPMR